jgi:AcrR family transcriptional regulator
MTDNMTDSMQEKREAILKAALKLFAERGFDGTPTALISREAGVSTGTLFRYFPTKEDLINSAYLRAKDHLAETIGAGLVEQRTLEAKMQRIWGNMIRWGLGNPEELLFLEQFVSSPYIAGITEEEAMRKLAFIGDLLDEGVRNGRLRDLRKDLIYEIVFSANRAVIRKILKNGLQGQTDSLIDGSFELVWSGLSK